MSADRLSVQELAIRIAALLPVAPLIYFFALQASGIDHRPAYFAAWSVLVWVVPLALLMPGALRRGLILTPVDLLFAVFSILLVLHLSFFTLEASVRHWVLLATFWAGPYAAARLIPAARLETFLTTIGLVTFIIAVGSIAWQLWMQLTVGSNVRPMLLGVVHGAHLVALALGIFVVLASSGVMAMTLWTTCAVAALATAQLVLLGSRGVFMAVMAGGIVMVLAPVNDRRIARAMVFAAILSGAALTMTLNSVARDFLVRAYVPIEQPIGAGIPSVSKEVAGLSAEECDRLSKLVDSTPIRIWLFRQGLALAQEYPVAGIGLENYAAYTCPGAFPHSTVLQSFVELGAFGGLVFALLLIVAALSTALAALDRRSALPLARAGIGTFALLAFFVLLDQFYGRLLLSSTIAMTLGIAATIAAQSDRRVIRSWLPRRSEAPSPAIESRLT